MSDQKPKKETVDEMIKKVDNKPQKPLSEQGLDPKRTMTRSMYNKLLEGNNKVEEKHMPIFTPVTAPRITGISRQELVLFRRLRHEYEAMLEERGEGIEPWSYKSSFDTILLHSVCKYHLKKQLEDTTELELKQFIDNRLMETCRPKDLDGLIAKYLKMDLRDQDIHSRVLTLFTTMENLEAING